MQFVELDWNQKTKECSENIRLNEAAVDVGTSHHGAAGGAFY